MYQRRLCVVLILLIYPLSLLNAQVSPTTTRQAAAPTLLDFWEGRAEWVQEIEDVGLPIGESDTLAMGDGVFWSYLHASHQSAGVIDQCGMPVEFPGCLTRWESVDGGESFSLPAPVCLMPCERCPCDDQRDHITAQQYPRVTRAGDDFYLTYEWRAQTILRRSSDGLNWSDWDYLRVPSGTWPSSVFPCSAVERIGPHPNIRGEVHDCLVGAPPGIYVEGDTLYVFVAAGSAPGHMRCYKGDRHGDLSQLQPCSTDPLFEGAREYGAVDLLGAEANAYFDFRYVSSAEVVRVGDRYYMFYEGIRGPDVLERGMDTQFGLGLARSLTDQIDGAWEKFPGNPLLMDMTFNWGVGHADFVLIDGVSYLYTATSQETRGRYRLEWRSGS
ncbi:MAG: hypothetical protein SF029_15760 [bacterium]|nr:hypothetical protein [bacterium]